MIYKDQDLKVRGWNLIILLNETHIMLGRESLGSDKMRTYENGGCSCYLLLSSKNKGF